MFFKSLCCVLLFLNFNIAQSEVFGVDTVYYFNKGIGQNSGQQPEYFPKNIFGMPSKNSNKNVPESNPEEICSLGFGGEIVLGIKDNLIINGEGYDFKIFENVFINPINKKYFAEPAVVSVSIDGVNFIEFPYDYNTLVGCAGTRPTEKDDTTGFNLDDKGGNSFDLSDIGLEYIKYIKIKDITELIANDPNHLYYDPVLTGFDLDAVVAKYVAKDNITSVNYNNNESKEMLNKFKITKNNNKLIIYSDSKLNLNDCEIIIFDLLGNVLFNKQNQLLNDNQFQNLLEIDISIPNQLIIINIIYKSNNFTYKIY